jgi:hypothetical protein
MPPSGGPFPETAGPAADLDPEQHNVRCETSEEGMGTEALFYCRTTKDVPAGTEVGVARPLQITFGPTRLFHPPVELLSSHLPSPWQLVVPYTTRPGSRTSAKLMMDYGFLPTGRNPDEAAVLEVVVACLPPPLGADQQRACSRLQLPAYPDAASAMMEKFGFKRCGASHGSARGTVCPLSLVEQEGRR